MSALWWGGSSVVTKLCLAIDKSAIKRYERIRDSKYVLTSFYYYKERLPFEPELHLVDSGAFTMFSSTKAIDIDEYVKQYIDYINKYDIRYYFELDIDSVVGYKKVLDIRDRLECGTGKQCIPVWHHSRGKDEFIKMCKEYNYAAIGGIASKECIVNHKDKFILLNKLAKQHGCKLHGLGATGKDIDKMGFYSVDSTSWISGWKFGQIHKFNGTAIRSRGTSDKKCINGRVLNEHNLNEWLKYQEYLKGVNIV